MVWMPGVTKVTGSSNTPLLSVVTVPNTVSSSDKIIVWPLTGAPKASIRVPARRADRSTMARSGVWSLKTVFIQTANGCATVIGS